MLPMLIVPALEDAPPLEEPAALLLLLPLEPQAAIAAAARMAVIPAATPRSLPCPDPRTFSSIL
jgi:hypothetical protein